MALHLKLSDSMSTFVLFTVAVLFCSVSAFVIHLEAKGHQAFAPQSKDMVLRIKRQPCSMHAIDKVDYIVGARLNRYRQEYSLAVQLLPKRSDWRSH